MPRRFYPQPLRSKSAGKLIRLPRARVWLILVAGLVVGIAGFLLWPNAQLRQGDAEREKTHLPDPTTESRGNVAIAAVPMEQSDRNDVGDVEAGAPDPSQPMIEPRSVVRVQVLNGCGRKGLAKWLSPALRAKGFDVRETSNADRFDYPTTLIVDRTGARQNGLRLADSLGIEPARVTTEISHRLADIDVTLIVGADYRSLSLGIPE